MIVVIIIQKKMFCKNHFFMNSSTIFDEIINVLNEETIGSSMAMMGNTAFAISDSPNTSLKDTIITKIDNTGYKFL